MASAQDTRNVWVSHNGVILCAVVPSAGNIYNILEKISSEHNVGQLQSLQLLHPVTNDVVDPRTLLSSLAEYGTSDLGSPPFPVRVVNSKPIIPSGAVGQPVSADVDFFWANLSQANFDLDAKLLTLVDSSRFLGNLSNPSSLFVRKCYQELSDLIISAVKNGSRGYAILGNPGIGKTFFAFYMLWRLRKDYPKAVIIWDQRDATEILCFTESGVTKWQNQFDLGSLLDMPSTWYLVDGQAPKKVNATTLVFSSPRKENFHEFLKRTQEGVRSAYMPVWEFDELIQAMKSCFPSLDEETVAAAYSTWGGIPRYVLAPKENKDYNLQLLGRAIAETNLDKVIYSVGQLSSTQDVSHMTLHIIVDTENEDPPTWNTIHMEFASTYVEQLVLTQMMLQEKEKLERFLKSSAAADELGMVSALRGYLFECYVHRILPLGGSFKVKRLNDHVRPHTLHVPKSEPRLFNTLSAQADPKNRPLWNNYIYNRPYARNFGAVDSILLPIGFFQSTVSPKHPIKADSLKNVMQSLASDRKKLTKFYFVVPDDIYDNFTGVQPFTDAKGKTVIRTPAELQQIEQYAMSFPMSGSARPSKRARIN